MAVPPEKPPLRSEDTIWTYRYLRIGMVGAVVLLAASIAIERSKVDCWQTSISAYYYTPVRAIFVGTLLAVALALIAYKGKGTWEDLSLNFAGMFAPVVAVAPTTDVGRCWSLAPSPLPVKDDGSLAEWVVTNIDNNIYALLIAGVVGLVVSAITNIVLRRVSEVKRSTLIALGLTALVLAAVWWLMQSWDDFSTRAHGYAAVLMFVFLIGAIVANVIEQWGERKKDRRNKRWSWVYMVVAALMVLGGIFLWLTRIFDEHTVFALETYEIVFFALYWSAQTVDNWSEEVIPTGNERSQRAAPPPADDAASTRATGA
jgi:hypothetical protein